MKTESFLTRLDAHRKAGRLGDEAFAQISKYELQTNIESDTKHLSDSSEMDAASKGSVLKNGSIRFSLGVVSAIGATLILVGVGLLSSLIEDGFGVDVYVPMFAVLAGLAYFAPGINVQGRAQVFVGEARSILFGVAAMVAVIWYLEVIIDPHWDETLGPGNVYMWAPALAVAYTAVVFARKMEAWVSYCSSWILWFYPLIYVIDYGRGDWESLLSLVVVMGVLTFELVSEWRSEKRSQSSIVQASLLGMMWGIMAWFSLEAFEETLGNDVVTPLVYVAGWMVCIEWFSRTQIHRYYPAGINKSWLFTLGMLVFYTGVPLYAGFTVADWIGWEEIEILDFNMHLGYVLGLLLHVVMGLQMFDWKMSNVVLKPSLTSPGSFSGSVFFLMAFIWFIFATVDLLEDLAGYLFLPLGLIVLIVGTKRLIDSSSEPYEDE